MSNSQSLIHSAIWVVRKEFHKTNNKFILQKLHDKTLLITVLFNFYFTVYHLMASLPISFNDRISQELDTQKIA